jgi:methanogenic corrinoid protein MtbC1
MNIQDTIREAIRQADRAGANAALDAWTAEHGVERLFTDVLDPVLHQVGRDWRTSESFTLAQAYVAAKIAEDVLVRLAPSANPITDFGPVVIGNIEEDFHGLGRRMVATFLRSRGWTVHDLGNDVPAAEFVDKAIATGARVIGASAMMLSTALNIRRLREEIDRRGMKGRIQLAVGGAIFVVRPELVAEVGGEGTATNALGAPDVFERLWRDSCHLFPSP